jgi:hypothetical protein
LKGAQPTSSLFRGDAAAAAAFDLLYLSSWTKASHHLDEAVIMNSQAAQETADPGWQIAFFLSHDWNLWC